MDHEETFAVLILSLTIYGIILLTKIFTWIKMVLIISVIGGVFLRYEYVNLLIVVWFLSMLAGTFLYLLFIK